ncbi:MAG: hypothetical protein QM831_11410 [Kofleriaceae bacterium]
MRWPFVVLAACGGDPTLATPDAAPTGCTAKLDGNLIDTVTSPEVCPTLDDDTLSFTIMSARIGEPLGIQIAPVSVGMSSSDTATWSAIGIRELADGGACVYLAGSSSVPSGYFTLDLTSIDPPSGVLRMSLAVLARTTDQGMQSDCGAGSTESLTVTF